MVKFSVITSVTSDHSPFHLVSCKWKCYLNYVSGACSMWPNLLRNKTFYDWSLISIGWSTETFQESTTSHPASTSHLTLYSLFVVQIADKVEWCRWGGMVRLTLKNCKSSSFFSNSWRVKEINLIKICLCLKEVKGRWYPWCAVRNLFKMDVENTNFGFSVLNIFKKSSNKRSKVSDSYCCYSGCSYW